MQKNVSIIFLPDTFFQYSLLAEVDSINHLIMEPLGFLTALKENAHSGMIDVGVKVVDHKPTVLDTDLFNLREWNRAIPIEDELVANDNTLVEAIKVLR